MSFESIRIFGLSHKVAYLLAGIDNWARFRGLPRSPTTSIQAKETLMWCCVPQRKMMDRPSLVDRASRSSGWHFNYYSESKLNLMNRNWEAANLVSLLISGHNINSTLYVLCNVLIPFESIPGRQILLPLAHFVSSSSAAASPGQSICLLGNRSWKPWCWWAVIPPSFTLNRLISWQQHVPQSIICTKWAGHGTAWRLRLSNIFHPFVV